MPVKAQSGREAKVNIGGIVVFLETDLSCIVIATAVVDSSTEHRTDSRGEVTKKKLDLELPSILRSVLHDPLCLVLRFALLTHCSAIPLTSLVFSMNSDI